MTEGSGQQAFFSTLLELELQTANGRPSRCSETAFEVVLTEYVFYAHEQTRRGGLRPGDAIAGPESYFVDSAEAVHARHIAEDRRQVVGGCQHVAGQE